MPVLTGSQTLWGYVWEDNGEYAQDPGSPTDSTVKAFGSQEDVSEPDADNNVESLYRPFNREPSNHLEMQFDGSWGTDFIYTNPWWLAFIFGEPDITEDSSATPTEYILDYSNRTDVAPKTAHLIEETHYRNGDVTQTVYTGCGVDSPSLDTSLGDPMNVSLSGYYAYEETYDTTGNFPYGPVNNQPDTQFRPLNFANANLYLDLNDDGTAEVKGKVQDVEVDFAAESEAEGEIGTRFKVERSMLGMEPSLSYAARITEETQDVERNNFYGTLSGNPDYIAPSEDMANADVTGSVELSARKESNDLSVDFNEAFPSSYSRPGLADVESAIDDDVERMLLDVTCSATIAVDPITYFPEASIT